MSHQIYLDDGTHIAVYCGPIREDGGDRRRIEVRARDSTLLADYPLITDTSVEHPCTECGKEFTQCEHGYASYVQEKITGGLEK